MPIYTRDNINYGGMLQAALQNKANYLKNRYDRVAQMGQNWGNAVANSGKVAQDAMFKIAGNYYDQDKIAQQQAFQASEAEKRALEALERQKQQEEFQKAENALNRQNTMDIAKLNKEIAAEDKKDEYQLHYQKAKAALDLANTALSNDKNNAQLQKAVADAQFDVDYWAKKAGIKQEAQQVPEFSKAFLAEASGQTTQPTAATLAFDNAAITKQVDTIFNGTWDNANRNKAMGLIEQIKDEALKNDYLQRVKNKGYTEEEGKALAAIALKKANDEWQRSGVYDPTKYKIVYEGPNNAHLERK